MNKEWQKVFNVSEEDQNKWKQSDQTDSFLTWALKYKKIHLDQYIDWAMQHYHLPFLKDSFFYDLTISQQLWDSVKDREKWNKGFVPIYEWEKTIFAGCLEPPEQKQDKNTIPILVSPKNLNTFWNKIQSFSRTKLEPLKKSNKNNTEEEGIKQTPGVLKKPMNLLNTVISHTLFAQMKISAENQTYNQIFKISKKYFTGVILFSFNNNIFTPVEWSDAMEGPATPVKIDKPSIFKMIANSKSPYHGFIIKNEQHIQFFAPWGFAELPKHVTLIPVFNNSKQMIGAFMGIAKTMIHQKHLREITSWTTPLSKAIQKTEELNKEAA